MKIKKIIKKNKIKTKGEKYPTDKKEINYHYFFKLI